MRVIRKTTPHQELLEQCVIDCKNCCGLCCVALYFAKTDGFPSDKAAGKPCKNLQTDFRCTIHQDLLSIGMRGCLAYDCLGAGQLVTQKLYRCKDWRTEPKGAEEMFRTFVAVYQLRQMLWYLIEVTTIPFAEALLEDVRRLIQANQQICRSTPQAVLAFDIEAYRSDVNKLLKRACTLLQQGMGQKQATKNKDFFGKNWRKAGLTGYDFSMALLIAADLRGCQVQGANFLGADMRDTDIRGVDLRESFFLTQGQINAARGDSATKLPGHLTLPVVWLKA